MIDFTALPKGRGGWADLVEHLAATGDAFETDYLEVKSDVDPTSRPGRAKIAKYILGSANRMPDVAARHFDGHGVMVLGVTEGEIRGVPSIDEKDLRGYLSVYTGTGERPDWWTEIVEARDKPGAYVLIVIVGPPRYGDPIFPCRKEFTDPAAGKAKPLLTKGEVYVRRSSQTVQANADEIDALCRRLSTGHVAEADPLVTIRGEVYRVGYEEKLPDAFIATVRERLGPPPGIGVGGYDWRGWEGFQRDLDDWESKFRGRWSEIVDCVVGAVASPIVIEAVNREGAWLDAPEIHATVRGACLAVAINDMDRADLEKEIPDFPASWASSAIAHYIGGHGAANWPPYEGETPTRIELGEVYYDDRGEHMRLSMALRDLRVGNPPVDAETQFVLTTSEDAGVELQVEWTLTAAADHSKVYSGTSVLPVVELDVTEWLKKALGEALPPLR